MAEILDKTREWSERFGHILRASPQTRFSHLYKGAVGGLEHVISVDNGGYYMEMWRDGGDQYYATTGAAIKPLPGLAKGARLDEALDRFFTLMAKVEKGKDIRAEAYRRGKGQRRMNPMKRAQATPHSHPHSEPHTHGKAGVSYAGGSQSPGPRSPIHSHPVHKGQEWYGQSKLNPQRKRPVRKNVVEKVDPEIGPSMSVGHRKPSDLSPESSMRKLAKRIVKNVVALTGNQPGSGRVKPPAPKTYRSPQGFSGRRMGTPGAPGASRSGMVRRGQVKKVTGGWTQPSGGTRPVSMPKPGSPGAPVGYGSTGQPQYSYGRKACKGNPCPYKLLHKEVSKAVRAVNKQRGWGSESHKEFWEEISRAEPGGHTACAERMQGKVRDPHAFCAWAEHESTGHWPAEKKAAPKAKKPKVKPVTYSRDPTTRWSAPTY